MSSNTISYCEICGKQLTFNEVWTTGHALCEEHRRDLLLMNEDWILKENRRRKYDGWIRHYCSECNYHKFRIEDGIARCENCGSPFKCCDNAIIFEEENI